MLPFALLGLLSDGLLPLGPPRPAAAQEPATQRSARGQDTASAPEPATFVGQVVSATTGKPIEGAVVSLLRSGYGAITDSTGNFRIPRTPAGLDTVEVRFIGYEPGKMEIELEPHRTTHVVLLLSQTVLRLADIRVEVERTRGGKLAGFWQRRELGHGYFITPREVQSRKPLRLPSDLLRGVPGLVVGRPQFGQAPVYIGRGRRCKPALFLDGSYMGNMNVDDIAPEEVGAVEVYRGPAETPAEFMTGAGLDCGAIVIWTPEEVEEGRAP